MGLDMGQIFFGKESEEIFAIPFGYDYCVIDDRCMLTDWECRSKCLGGWSLKERRAQFDQLPYLS